MNQKTNLKIDTRRDLDSCTGFLLSLAAGVVFWVLIIAGIAGWIGWLLK